MSSLLNFERIVDGGTFNNLIVVIINSFVVFGWDVKNWLY
jgi:hypothetical protein